MQSTPVGKSQRPISLVTEALLDRIGQKCDIDSRMSPLEVLRRGGSVSDEAFDEAYPAWVQELSEMFWTPVAVALHAAQLLVVNPGDRVLDVGSGVGKFCVIAAATTEGIFHGIEQRESLVGVARAYAARHSWCQERLDFRQGDATLQSFTEYEAVYLYNPFFEQTSGPWVQIDDTIPYSRDIQARYVDAMVRKLDAAPHGFRVATYFGFGGKMPGQYCKLSYEQFDKGPLEVWIKE